MKNIEQDKMLLRKTIGNNLRNLRYASGYTQEDIGNVLGVSFQQIQKYERAINRLAAEDIFSLANFLGVKVEDFYKDLSGHTYKLDKKYLEIIRQLRTIENPNVKNKIMNLMSVMANEDHNLVSKLN